MHLLPLFPAQEKGVLAWCPSCPMYELPQLPLQGTDSGSVQGGCGGACYCPLPCSGCPRPAPLPPPQHTSLNPAGRSQRAGRHPSNYVILGELLRHSMFHFPHL